MLIEPNLTLEIIIVLNHKQQYHDRPFKYCWFMSFMEGLLSQSFVSHLERQRGFLYVLQEKQTNKQTLESSRFYNLSVYYKKVFLSKCPRSKKGTDFQTSSELTPTLNIIPVSSAHFQVSKLKSFSCHSLLVKSIIFVPVIGFFF